MGYFDGWGFALLVEEVWHALPGEGLAEGTEVALLVQAFIVGLENGEVVDAGQAFEVLHTGFLALWL